MEVRKAGFVEDLAGLRDRIALVGGGRVLGRERVHEAERELLERERHHAVPLGGVSEGRSRRLQRLQRQRHDALRRRGAHRDAGAPEATVEQ